MFGGGAEESNTFGQNNYEKKAEDAQRAFDESFTVDDIADLGNAASKFFTKDLPKSTMWALRTAKTVMTPGFIKRNNAKKIHIQQVEREER